MKLNLSTFLLGLGVSVSSWGFLATATAVNDNHDNLPQKMSVLEENVPFNHNHLASVLSHAKHQNPVSLSFDVEGDQIDCDLTESALMAAGLKKKFPHIMALIGACNDGSTVSITINAKQRGTFYASIYKDGVQFYAKPDPLPYTYAQNGDNGDEDEVLSIFRYSDINLPEGFEWSEKNEDMTSSEHFQSQSSIQAQTDKAFKFRIAVIATKEYSSLHGNTVDSVFTEIVTAIAVVNGIYLREIGIMFELIEKSKELICISESSDDDCDNLPNDNSVLDMAADFISSRGVESSEYDIGHTFTGGVGTGVAEKGLCDSDGKAMGRTGQQFGDPSTLFYVDYLTHELGHQLSADHTFRNCNKKNSGDDDNFSETDAVEPGGGTTIMGYAGICLNNVQDRSAPHFNSLHLEIIRAYVESQASSATCGVSVNLDTAAPIMNTLATCIVPKGNYVQLSGRVDNIDNIASGSVYFAWDRIDPGTQDYLDKDVPRFAPLAPTTRSHKRYLPNLYVISYDVDTLREIAPKETVTGDEEMKFRFVGRTNYDKDANPISDFDSALVGRFGYVDMELTYSTAHDPLKFVACPTELIESETVEITWTGGATLTENVEILVAVNTMVKVDEDEDANFDNVVKDLEWTSLGTFQSSDGEASTTIPFISNPENLSLNIMIRSTGNDDDDCYFFDMKSGLDYNATPSSSPSVSAVPSASPSMSPPKSKASKHYLKTPTSKKSKMNKSPLFE
mmetsp:Transcript_12854/g.25854  ORF Transcript_12854/g.25854 Transcript_12854/m.25854 type:complete len:735 (-) Transcript_12854:1208-3412(-)